MNSTALPASSRPASANSSTFEVPASPVWPAGRHSQGGASSQPKTGISWLRLAKVGALLAIAAQMVVMALLAQYQVQRGVQLRQTQAIGMTEGRAVGRTQDGLQLHTASATQGDVGTAPSHALR